MKVKTVDIEAVYYIESCGLSKRFPFLVYCCFDHIYRIQNQEHWIESILIIA